MTRIETYSLRQPDVPYKLNRNESPLDLPDFLKETIIGRIRECEWNRYPNQQPQKIISLLSGYMGVEEGSILFGNGSNELIQSLLLFFRPRVSTLVIADPSFSMYERTAGIIGLQVRKVPLRDDFSFDIPGFLNAVSDDSLLVIDSPNNPSGSALSIPEIERILREGKVDTVIDEAYFEFNGITSATLLKQYPNLIILRTFSKALCLAGLRFGYLLCDPRLHGEIDKYRQPFSVSSLTQIAAESVLENIGYLLRIHTEISRQRERLFSGMLNLDGIRPYPSRANFILTEFTGSSSRDVFDQLLNEGILVRDFSHPRLENKLRITVGTKEENAFFLNVLSKILRRRK